MMWNWLVSSLAVGATVVLYDGSPMYPNTDAMFEIVDKEQVSIFGTSAKYIASLSKAGYKPKEHHQLDQLRTILSTGSPLTAEYFDYIYQAVKQDLCLSSISGGTDIVSCFALGNPALPVYRGEIQCQGLGMDVDFLDDAGNSAVGTRGELVCKCAFPSMPVGFWRDEAQQKYRAAYFERFDNYWAHGDFGMLTENGGIIIFGRSDAVLNPGGIRIGTAEIYRQVEKHPQVIDCVAVGQEWQDDERVILFVVLRDNIELTAEITAEIKQLIRANTTPRHVPAKIIQVREIPRTISGKVVELAVRNIIHGQAVKNTEALANPEALKLFENLVELKS
jgi:acetoacetyl-CoA synthetase